MFDSFLFTTQNNAYLYLIKMNYNFIVIYNIRKLDVVENYHFSFSSNYVTSPKWGQYGSKFSIFNKISIVIPFFGKVFTILHFTQPFNWFCLQLVTNQLFQSNFFFFLHHLSFKTNPSKINILYFVLQQFFLLSLSSFFCLIHLLLQRLLFSDF